MLIGDDMYESGAGLPCLLSAAGGVAVLVALKRHVA
jgi:hypothetical protein